MPANLPPLYYEKEKLLRFAQSIPEKIEIIQEMIAIMPKHKGTDRLQADLRAKISRLKKDFKKQPATRKTDFYHIPKEGAGQCVFIGPPNAGKTHLINALANTEYPIGNYPFTTKKPDVGMMKYQNVQVQIVDMPPLYDDFHPGWIMGIVRNADVVALIFNGCSEKNIRGIPKVFHYLEKGNIKIISPDSNETSDELLLKKGFIIITHIDICEEKHSESLKKKWNIPVFNVSIYEQDTLKKLNKELFSSLNVIRIYTKRPHKEADLTEPVVLKEGSTVMDAAYHIHKDFAHNLKFARLWREKEEKKGIHISRNEVLKEGDIIEFHI